MVSERRHLEHADIAGVAEAEFAGRDPRRYAEVGFPPATAAGEVKSRPLNATMKRTVITDPPKLSGRSVGSKVSPSVERRI